jgi:hypothetical protein
MSTPKLVGAALVAVLKRLEEDPGAGKDEFVRLVLDQAFRDFSNTFFHLYRGDRDSNTHGWKGRVDGHMTNTVATALRTHGEWPGGGEAARGPDGVWGQFRQDVEDLSAILTHELEHNTAVLCTDQDYERVAARREHGRKRGGHEGAYVLCPLSPRVGRAAGGYR